MKSRIFVVIGALALIALCVVLVKVIGKHAPAFASFTSPSVNNAQKEAKALEEKGDLVAARQAYQNLIRQYPESRLVNDWQKSSESIAMRMLFSPEITPGSIAYEVQPGDSLSKIAKEYNTTVELIARMNGLAGSTIRPGQKIKVFTMPLSVLVDKSQNILVLRTQDEIVKTYIVSTGVNNSTPVGTFKITNKLENPTWFKAGAVVAPGTPENALGSRWMGIDAPGYGIHGTIEPDKIGQQVTQGCVRMVNADVEELYMLLPAGTEVTIID